MGNAVATIPPASEGAGPHCSIAQTDKGWVLVIRDEQVSVMQMFDSLSSARRATERMHTFFVDMRDQGVPSPNQPSQSA
jgi:hypothetical protein